MSALRAPAVAPRRPAAAPGAVPAGPSRRTPLTALPGGAFERRRRLDVVRAPLQATSSVPFFVLCGFVLLAALLGALVLNVTMARGSYELARLQRDVGQVAQDVQTKQAALRAAEASLPEHARRLGMVPAENPTMFSVATGQVVGAAPEAP